jgi:hypothetical protein
METKDAMEDSWIKLSHSSKPKEFPQKMLMHTPPETENAKTLLQFSKTPDSLMSPLEVTANYLPPLTFNQSPLPLMLQATNSNLTAKEFWITNVQLNWTMEFYLLVMDLKMEKIIGWLKTHGEVDGENKDTLD